jgi:hypothetical protein
MIPALDDFTSKYGFRDGSASEPRDEIARELFVSRFNCKSKTIRAVTWDRPGMHNGVMIVFFERKRGWKPVQYIRAWHKQEIEPMNPQAVWLPDGSDPQDLLNEVYMCLVDEE